MSLHIQAQARRPPFSEGPQTVGRFFSERLLAWHRLHGRHHLPWQNSRDPYRIWVSEIMLQQTQVDTVLGYFDRFMARFPTVEALAEAPLEAVLGMWSGLGYYTRARHLHQAACMVCTQFEGRFPNTVADLLRLPGVGRSTASAIAAFAFSQREPILDGNVRRVICRVFGIEGRPGEKAHVDALWAWVEALMPLQEKDMPAYTQAQMDLGALLCRRTRPACAACPFADLCVAFNEERTGELPEPKARKTTPWRFSRVAILVDSTLTRPAVWLEQRPPKGLWGGLLTLPELPVAHETDAHALAALTEEEARAWVLSQHGLKVSRLRGLEPLDHAFSHFRLRIAPWLVSVEAQTGQGLRCAEPKPGQWVFLDALDEAPLPAPVRRLLMQAKNTLTHPDTLF